mmetsp:Transcript_19905/g.46477  ORF Transcript_19905/g.46477 Transcript_19905/m.46477 type:complete len:241 (-) Transcript_19905:254-976(-)
MSAPGQSLAVEDALGHQIPRQRRAVRFQQRVSGIPVDQIPESQLGKDDLLVERAEEIVRLNILSFHQLALAEAFEDREEALVNEEVVVFVFVVGGVGVGIGGGFVPVVAVVLEARIGGPGRELGKDGEVVSAKDQTSPLKVLEESQFFSQLRKQGDEGNRMNRSRQPKYGIQSEPPRRQHLGETPEGEFHLLLGVNRVVETLGTIRCKDPFLQVEPDERQKFLRRRQRRRRRQPPCCLDR